MVLITTRSTEPILKISLAIENHVICEFHRICINMYIYINPENKKQTLVWSKTKWARISYVPSCKYSQPLKYAMYEGKVLET